MSRLSALLERPSRAKTIVFFVAIALIPTLYAGLLTWSNIDPTGRLDGVSALIVNNDEGATDADGKPVTLGDDLAETLVDEHTDGSFTWSRATAAEADAQLAEGDAYIVVTIPADFSSSAVSVGEGADAARVATLEVRTDDATSMIVGTVAHRVGTDLARALSDKVAESVLSQMYVGFSDAHDAVAEAADGASQIADGAHDAADGSASLVVGLTDLRDGAANLDAGLADLASGTSSLSDGATQVADGLDQLSTSADALPAAADALAAGAADAADGAASLASNAQSLSDALAQLNTNWGAMDEATRQASVAALNDAAGRLAAGADGLSTGAATVASGSARLDAGVTSAVTAIDALAAGADDVAAGASRAAAGASDASTGAHDLAAGATDAASGAAELDSGLADLSDGSAELATSLHEGADEIPSYTSQEADSLAAVAADPVAADIVRDNEVENYGAGLAPYFLALALWVGGIAFYFVAPPLRKTGHITWLTGLRSYVPGAVMAAAQATTVVLVLRYAVGVPVANLPGLWALAVLASMAFLAINQALVALLGTVGRFIGLLLIVLQLSSAGGTYPVATAPSFFQGLNTVLPLPYAVTAFRDLIAGGTVSLGRGTLLTLAWTVAALLVTTLVAKRAMDRPKVLDKPLLANADRVSVSHDDAIALLARPLATPEASDESEDDAGFSELDIAAGEPADAEQVPAQARG